MSFFHLITIISKLSMLWHTAVIHLIFLMHNIPFCDCRKIYLFTIIFLFIYRIHLFKAFMVFQSFFLRWYRGKESACQCKRYRFNRGVRMIPWSYSVAQSCLTLCDPKECSTPGFPVHKPLSEW